MRDAYGRTIDYLRVSVTDRCNLRCRYCMPESGVPMLSHDQILTYDEILRICRIVSGLGIDTIKITGGEPLVRRDVEDLIAGIHNLPDIRQVTLTTNGVLLAEKLDALVRAGLSAVNVSLDTTDPQAFQAITRRDQLSSVLRGINAASREPRLQLKINCVPPSLTPDAILPIARLAQERDIAVRFIEMMPIGLGADLVREEDTEARIRTILAGAFGLPSPCDRKLGNGPAHYLRYPGLCGPIGFISAVSHQFCDQCNRVRLTSQGFLKTCLQYDLGEDLSGLLRGSSTDGEIAGVITRAIAHKPQAHQMQKKNIPHGEGDVMSKIGG